MKEINNNNKKFAFTKKNYILLAVGVLFIITGLFLMQGGGSDDPNFFPKENEGMMGFRRRTLSPIIILSGFIINIFAILYSPKGIEVKK